MKLFYVDVLLKLVEDENYAKDLIRRVLKMYSASRFNLISYNK